MDDQNKIIIKKFGEFALRIHGSVMNDVSLEDVKLVKDFLGLGISKRELPSRLGELFDTYDDVTAPYELYYNITCDQAGTEESFLNGMILRTLCCNGSHEREREILMSCDAVSKSIKSAIGN